jgi:hypothetical protein
MQNPLCIGAELQKPLLVQKQILHTPKSAHRSWQSVLQLLLWFLSADKISAAPEQDETEEKEKADVNLKQ